MSDGNVIKLRLSLMGRPVRNYTFDKSVINVGRDPGADVYVDNPGVSRDHFRLERTPAGEYRVVDLGSANGTFVNDQMVNASVVHNNDVVRFGKYTLWVGYELDRRASTREESFEAPPENAGHTVVLSRAEIGSILEKERQSERSQATARPRPVAVPAGPAAPARPARPAEPAAEPVQTWPSLLIGFAIGALFGAGTLWLLLNR